MDDQVLVSRSTYSEMAALIRMWDIWLGCKDDLALLAEIAAATAAFCGSEAGARMEHPLHFDGPSPEGET